MGSFGWDRAKLDEHIEERRGERLRVYSQEMALAMWLTGRDPYDSPDVLVAFGEGHAALEYLQEQGFDWPHSDIPPSVGAGIVAIREWPKVGLLRFVGYKVGMRGKSALERRVILAIVFSCDVPGVNSPA